MALSLAESLSYKNGTWSPLSELTWSITDLATTQGAMLVERLRTFGGTLLAVDEHLSRLADGARKLGIAWPPRRIEMNRLCQELISRNADLIQKEGDVGLVLLLSPGDPGIDRRQLMTPTVIAHLNPLPFAQLSKWYRNGAKLHFSSVRNVPAECWSPSIKTRSRLQYYLADHHHSISTDDRTHSTLSSAHQPTPSPDTIAVLMNLRGCITETSISNLLVLGNDDILRSPAWVDILWGISLKTVCQLAESLEQPLSFVDIVPEDVFRAKEVLMTGSTGCLWSAVSIDGHPIGDGRPGPLCDRLQKAWQESIGFNFVEQAHKRNG